MGLAIELIQFKEWIWVEQRFSVPWQIESTTKKHLYFRLWNKKLWYFNNIPLELQKESKELTAKPSKMQARNYILQLTQNKL